MTDAILLNKLITDFNNDDNFLFQCYKHSLSESGFTESFNQCISDLKALSNLSYDFKQLTNYATSMNITRRDIRQLCEILSSILGETITQLCNQNRELIITTPSRFEDFCPYPKAELVLYSTSISDIPIKYDSYMYKIIESKPENTPYYYIYCHLLERYN